jgi:GAF domain-containing protein
MTNQQKEEKYRHSIHQIKHILDESIDTIGAMSTIASILHSNFEYFSWTGFYRVAKQGLLIVGPYQGTEGCLYITFDKGVCGASATKKETIIVPDVNKFPGHIVCDPNSKSEIVVPVFDKNKNLIAVLDVDSQEYSAFNEIDKIYLEEIAKIFTNDHFIKTQ